mmetsp:Transcript_62724/g.149641  ORF Transcript_62724/g.149641 Transcript_62724/m.149641 type:complete len:611 (+) Transcript_62724:193-2025(+)
MHDQVVVSAAYILWAALLSLVPVTTLISCLRRNCSVLLHSNVRDILTFVKGGAAFKQPLDAVLMVNIGRKEAERALSRMHQTITLFILYLGPLHAIGALQFSVQAATVTDYDVGDYVAYLTEMPVMMAVMFWYHRPGLLSLQGVRGVYTFIALRQLVIMYLQLSEPDFSADNLLDLTTVFSSVARLVLSVALQNSNFTVGMNAVLMAPGVIIMHLLGAVHFHQQTPCSGSCCAHTSLGEMRGQHTLLLGLAVLECAATLVVERGTRASVLAEMEVQASKGFAKAADVLLSSMCDVVVHLSADLQITKGHAMLAALLLDVPGDDPQPNFHDVILSDEEREAFHMFLHRPTNNFAHTMHLQLVGKGSIVVSVQIYHTQFLDLNSDLVHIVGIRDCGDARPVPALEAEAPESTKLPTVRPRPRRFSQGVSSTLSSISESSVASDHTSPPLYTGGRNDEVKIWLGLRDGCRQLQIMRWSPNFLEIVGRSSLVAGANFSELVADEHMEAFGKKVHRVVSELFNLEVCSTVGLEVVIKSTFYGLVQLTGFASLIDEDQAHDASPAEFGTFSEDDPPVVLEFEVTSWQRVRRSRFLEARRGRSARRSWQNSSILLRL